MSQAEAGAAEASVVVRSDAEAIGFENMHMMSYLGASFSVSPRVANETAAILEYLEQREKETERKRWRRTTVEPPR